MAATPAPTPTAPRPTAVASHPTAHPAAAPVVRDRGRSCAGWSSLELYALVDGLTNERLAAVEAGGDETHLRLLDLHLDGPCAELSRRVRRHAAGTGPDPYPAWSRGVAAVAARVRREVDVRLPLDLHGWVPTRQSLAGEWAGPCPFCPGGHDRFVVWPATPDRDGRVWCRRCRYSADVIGLYRDLERVSFPAALSALGALTGVLPPDPDDDAMRALLGWARRAQGRPATERPR